MSTQVHFRIDDELKVIGDVILKVSGQTNTEVLSNLYKNYIFEKIGCTENKDLLEKAYTYVIECQEKERKPLELLLYELQAEREAEAAKELQYLELYRKVIDEERGRQLLAALTRRLEHTGLMERRRAIADVYEDYSFLIKSLFDMSDDNEIVDACMALAKIHSDLTTY